MRTATDIVFSRITPSDFFNIYKAQGTEERGGGQSYIDVNTSGVSVVDWTNFFRGIKPRAKKGGPAWNFPIGSLGIAGQQRLVIGQRRPASISIRSQKLPASSRRGNRVRAWDPSLTSFPAPATPPRTATDPTIPPLIRNLVIYLIRDSQGEFWAGWFERPDPDFTWAVPPQLERMFRDHEGYIVLPAGINFDERDGTWPFRLSTTAATSTSVQVATTPGSSSAAPTPAPRVPGVGTAPRSGSRRAPRVRSEEELTQELFDSDLVGDEGAARESTRTVRARNTRAARLLKDLYGECQITGNKFVFPKTDRKPYLEVHHLIPLGEGGADAAHNLVVVSAHIHRMLHYADVSGIDLSQIQNNELEIQINGEAYTIRWRPEHAQVVERENPPGD
jgi:5-methylcytosine-specific restriction protein A